MIYVFFCLHSDSFFFSFVCAQTQFSRENQLGNGGMFVCMCSILCACLFVHAFFCVFKFLLSFELYILHLQAKVPSCTLSLWTKPLMPSEC